MKIAVVGSINMDQVVQTDRIPKKGETLIGNALSYNDGGKGANQAVACALLGADVMMFGKVGDDDNGKNILSHLKNKNVNVDNVHIENGENTGLAVITVGENDNTIIVIKGANDKVDKKYIDEIKNELFKCDYVILQHEIPLETNEYIINICHEKGIKTVLNPAPANEVSKNVIDKVTYITPNEHEVKLIFGDEPIEDLLKKYKEKLVVTLGSNGATTYANDEIIKVPCIKANVVDTTGAGDTFNAAFVVGIAKGLDANKALNFANVAAGISTEKLGAQNGMPTLEEVEKRMNK